MPGENHRSRINHYFAILAGGKPSPTPDLGIIKCPDQATPIYRTLPRPDRCENPRPWHRCGGARCLRLAPSPASHSATVPGIEVIKTKHSSAECPPQAAGIPPSDTSIKTQATGSRAIDADARRATSNTAENFHHECPVRAASLARLPVACGKFS